jgi:hypothetical protein
MYTPLKIGTYNRPLFCENTLSRLKPFENKSDSLPIPVLHIPVRELPLKTKRYSSEIASVGQTPAHAPQLIQASASITRAPFASLIAPTGHSPSHAPQLTQASEIL